MQMTTKLLNIVANLSEGRINVKWLSGFFPA
jgi:hypothetical protein